MSFHHQSKIKVKGGYANVDIKIQLLVKWLNSFTGVKTIMSCQGDNRQNVVLCAPFIDFECNNNRSMYRIWRIIDRYMLSNKNRTNDIIYILISDVLFHKYNQREPYIEYRIAFITQSNMLKFTKYIEQDQNTIVDTKYVRF